jgi:hypothetical protein
MRLFREIAVLFILLQCTQAGAAFYVGGVELCEDEFSRLTGPKNARPGNREVKFLSKTKQLDTSFDHAIPNPELRRKLLSLGNGNEYPISAVTIETPEGIAHFYYRLIPGTDAIMADQSWVPDALRDQGINSLLFRAVVEKHPEVRRVAFFYAETNLEVFNQNKNASLGERLKSTPSFKSFSKLGFTKIDQVEEVTVDRGPPVGVGVYPFAILSR